MCVLMVVGFLVAWVPYASYAAWIFVNKGVAFTAVSMAIPAFFAKSSALFNPIIYVLMNKQVSLLGIDSKSSSTIYHIFTVYIYCIYLLYYIFLNE